MLDPTTSWIEIHAVPEARADLVTNQVKLAWLTWYPLPNKIVIDRGKDFLAEFKTMMANNYRTQCNLIPLVSEILKQMQYLKGYT